MWDEVSALLRKNNHAHRKPQSGSTPGLLTGILRDARGVRFTPPHTLKRGKHYRYYTSQAVIQGKANLSANARIPAPELESLVIGADRAHARVAREIFGQKTLVWNARKSWAEPRTWQANGQETSPQPNMSSWGMF